jgi:RNA polymerase subunit RPABC4/transcription elongation factor Spt4
MEEEEWFYCKPCDEEYLLPEGETRCPICEQEYLTNV